MTRGHTVKFLSTFAITRLTSEKKETHNRAVHETPLKDSSTYE